MILQVINQFIAAVPTAAGVENFDDLKPYVRSGEMWLKNNVLGAPLYDYINTWEETEESTGSAPGATDNQELIDLCNSVTANHAYWDAIPFLDLVHTNQGFAVISATNKVPASKERVERLRENCLLRRDSEVENLIAWLEAHSWYHSLWKSAPVYTILSNCLIQSATELQKYAQWEGGRKEFLVLQPKLIQQTMTKLEPVFSKDYIEELIEKQRTDDLESGDVKVIVMLKYALGSLVTDNIEAAEKIAADALRYIDANIEEFDTYAESGEYAARIQEGYTNTTDAPIFSSIF